MPQRLHIQMKDRRPVFLCLNGANATAAQGPDTADPKKKNLTLSGLFPIDQLLLPLP